MSKTLLVTAAFCVLLGAALVARAYVAEFDQALIHDDPWNGPNGPGTARGPMLIGILFLATGLAGVAVPVAGWLSSETVVPSTLSRNAFARIGFANTLAGRMPTRPTRPAR